METEQKDSQFEQVQDDAFHTLEESDEVVPGVPVVRSNTPRPLSFERIAIPGSAMGQSGIHFPTRAPAAPPLPEEAVEGAFPPLRLSEASQQIGEEAQDFAWLFEYGLEMDPVTLNSAHQLSGLALLYGPALLKGYTILCGNLQGGCGNDQPLLTIVPVADPAAEVWGVLYRIPRCFTERSGTDPSALDVAHQATTTHNLFKATSLVVRESYCNREIDCVAYVAGEEVLRQVSLVPLAQAEAQPLAQRLAAIARQQKLPANYLSFYEPQNVAAATNPAAVQLAPPCTIQDTEPLPVIKEKIASSLSSARTLEAPLKPASWLVGLALYLIFMLLLILAFAILQGLGVAWLAMTNKITLLNVPWLVVVYGLLGGSVSSLYSLARTRRFKPPLFVILTWFARPFVGGILALLSYLLLTSGAFVLNPDNVHQQPIFLLGGALSGLCENRLFFRNL